MPSASCPRSSAPDPKPSPKPHSRPPAVVIPTMPMAIKPFPRPYKPGSLSPSSSVPDHHLHFSRSCPWGQPYTHKPQPHSPQMGVPHFGEPPQSPSRPRLRSRGLLLGFLLLQGFPCTGVSQKCWNSCKKKGLRNGGIGVLGGWGCRSILSAAGERRHCMSPKPGPSKPSQPRDTQRASGQ